MPQNWKIYKLGDISTSITYGYTESASNEEIGPKFLRITDIQNSFISWEKVPYCPISEKDFEKYKLEIGDIVIARTGNSTGATALIKDKINAVYASYLIRYQLDNKIADPTFISYILRSKSWQDYVDAIKGGSAQPGANAQQFAQFIVILPPLSEQTAIASILSALDDKIELNLQMNKTLEEMAMALYKHWFVDFGPFKDGEFVESELGMIPKGWEVKRLDDILEIKRGGSPRPIQEFISTEGFHWLKISDATASSSPFMYNTKEFIKKEGLSKTILIKPGSIILSNSATPGLPRLIEFETCIHDGWLHFPEIKRFNRYILYLLFLDIKNYLIQQGNGSVFTNLKTDILKSQIFNLPPVEIEIEFSKIITPWFEKIKTNTVENISLIAKRDSLLPKLISGEIRVKDLEKN